MTLDLNSRLSTPLTDKIDPPAFRRSHTVYRQMYIVSVGGLGTGFLFYGPFKTYSVAHEWVLDNLGVGVIWGIQPLSIISPQEPE